MTFNQAIARQTSIIAFRHVDGTEHGGVVGSTLAETFRVTSFPRYGDTKGRQFRYEDVAEITRADPRDYVPLATFSRLMGGN